MCISIGFHLFFPQLKIKQNGDSWPLAFISNVHYLAGSSWVDDPEGRWSCVPCNRLHCPNLYSIISWRIYENQGTIWLTEFENNKMVGTG